MELFEHAFPIEDSVIHGPRGRYFLPVFATGQSKELTATRTAVLIAVSLAVVLAILTVIGVWVLEPPKEFYEHTEDLSALIGQTPEAVYESLAEAEAGMVHAGGDLYAIPGGVEFAGANFEVLLEFDESGNRLDSFSYATTMKATPKETAKILHNILRQFFYESVTLQDGTEIKIGRAEILAALQNADTFVLTNSNNITPNSALNYAVSQYIAALEGEDTWEGRVGEYLVREAKYYRDVEVRYEPDTQNLYIRIRQAVEADRDKN